VPAALPGLRAGFGRVDITLAGLDSPATVRRAGRAAGYRVHLYARALLLEIGRASASRSSSRSRAGHPNLHRLTAARIRDSTGIGADRLVIAATHVHSGPGISTPSASKPEHVAGRGLRSAMVEFLVSRFARAVLDARRDLRRHGRVECYCGVGTHAQSELRSLPRNQARVDAPAPVTPGLDPTHRAVNPLWTLLRVDQRGVGADSAYRPAGAFSVFALHGTADAPENEPARRRHPRDHRTGARAARRLASRRGAGYHRGERSGGDVSPDWPAQSRCGAPVLRPWWGRAAPHPATPWEWRDPALLDGVCASRRAPLRQHRRRLARRARVALFDSLGPACAATCVSAWRSAPCA